jgi:hypothetical protein
MCAQSSSIRRHFTLLARSIACLPFSDLVMDARLLLAFFFSGLHG